MKAKVRKILLNIFLYMVFVLLWGAILFVLSLIRMFGTFLDRFADGALLTIFAVISVIGLIIPILFIRKKKSTWMLPLFLIVSTIITTAINYGIFYGACDYMSVYTKEKWEKYPHVRYCMLDNLKEQYDFIGLTEQELKEILGEPTYVIKYSGQTKYKGYTAYQYMIGDDYIDGYTYDFIFENGIVIDTSVSQT